MSNSNLSTIEIPLGKQKITLLLIGSVIFTALCAWMAIAAADTRGNLSINSFILQTLGVLGFLFFGACTIYAYQKMIDDRPGLIIDRNGITDNSSAIAVGLVEWKDIRGIRVKKTGTNRFIMIDLDDPEKYISRASGLPRLAMQANLKFYGSPLAISSNTLNYDFEDLVEVLQENWEEYG